MAIDTAIIVRAHTRLEELVARHNTPQQSRFYVESRGGNFDEYVAEHDAFYHSFELVNKQLASYLKTKVIERQFLPNFLFARNHLAVVVGRDGLVANTAKYVAGLPILAINPDRQRNDGVLLPFTPQNFVPMLPGILKGQFPHKRVTMAEARLNDGQRLLAFNDLFIGPTSHISLRYRIRQGAQAEMHSSSGIIVSTGAGSTGWMSSLFNMAQGIWRSFGAPADTAPPGEGGLTLPWETPRLLYVVREPFASQASQVNITAGYVTPDSPLVLESYMPTQGTIFSDGVERDFLHFNSGSIATIGIAPEQAVLVVQH
ncbi:MAG: sugar kinase [Bacteroidetes bacterium]|nr:sugar kinase [Bacteroidota bacterium]